MPAVALSALDIVVVALTAIILIYAITMLVQWLVAMIPDNIPFIGGWLKSTISHGVAAGQKAIRASVEFAANPLYNIFMYTVHDAVYLVWHIHTWMISAGDTISWIKTHDLPHAISGANAREKKDYAAARSYSWTTHKWAENYTRYKYAQSESHIGTAERTEKKDITAARAYTRSYSWQAHNWAKDYALYKFEQSEAHISAVQHTAKTDTVASETASKAYTYQLHKLAEHDIATNATKAHADAKAQAQHYATTATHSLTTDVTGAIAPVWSGIRDTVDGIEQELAGIPSDIATAVKAIPVAKPGTIAETTAATAALSLAAARYLKECGLPMCRNLSGFGNDLSKLVGIMGSAAFMAALFEGIRHPEQGAHDLEDGLGSYARGISNELTKLAGL